jgi:hypothetical protein
MRRVRLVATLVVSFGCAYSGKARAQDESSVRLLSLEAFAGAHSAGYSTVGSDTQVLAGAQAGIGLPFAGPIRARSDLMVGHFATGETALVAAGRVYHQEARWLVGASYDYTFITGGIHSQRVALHGEVYEEAWFGVTSSFGVERPNFGDALGFGELFLRFYPMRTLLVWSGVSYAVSDLKQTRADILLHAEYAWELPGNVSLALYAQYGGNLFTKASAGVVLYLDALGYAARERRDGLFGARFR